MFLPERSQCLQKQNAIAASTVNCRFLASLSDLRPAGWLAGWLAGPQAWLAGPQAWLAGPQARLAGLQAWLAGPEGGTDGCRDVHKENLPILQDFIPYRGRCQKRQNAS